VSNRAIQMLAIMESIACSVMPQKSKRKRTLTRPIKLGNLNKICKGCGHKNKKCTCSGGENEIEQVKKGDMQNG